MPDWRDRIRNPDCTLCPLHESAEHVCLLGSGPPRAKVMIIGEAPGAREDDEHRAFVGRAGQLLDKSLDDLTDIRREDCYVSNVAKCRPPLNATPTRREAKICTDTYLWDEIEHVKPDFILLLGNSPLQAVLGKSGILKQHGSVFKRNIRGRSVTLMATIHPAGVLRNPSWAEPYGMDIQRFGRMVAGEATSPATRIFLAMTRRHLELLQRRLNEAAEVTWDVETYTVPAEAPYVRSNLQDWHGDESMIVCMAFTWQDGLSVVVPIHHSETPWRDPAGVLHWLLKVLQRKAVNGHNLKYDARWAASKGHRLGQHFCTMIAAHMLDENRSKGLKNLSRIILGADAYDVGEELRDAYHMPLRRLAIYNGKDTDYTHRLKKRFAAQLAKEPRVDKVFRELMMPASEALVDIERTGVWLDPVRWRERHEEAAERKQVLYDYINRWVPKDLRPINLNSPQQVGRLLFEQLDLPVLERTKTGAPSTREGVLLRLAKMHKATTAMIKYRKWAKYLNTYLEPWWYEHMDANGRIHSNYKLFGTVTGRLSGEGGIQQVPRDPFIRSIIGAPPGWLFVAADFSQIELRIAAMLSGENRMLRQFMHGEDIHMERAIKSSYGRIIHDTHMLLVRSGLPSNRAGAEVLSELWDQAPQGGTAVHQLEKAYKAWQESGGRKRWQSVRPSQSDVARWLDLRNPKEVQSQEFVRAVRERAIPLFASQGRGSKERSSLELADAVSFMSRVGASVAQELPEWKERRKKAKAISFGFVYGMSAGKFSDYAFESYDLEISPEEAQHDRELFFQDYPALRPWHERQRRLARRYHRVVSPIGRVRHLTNILSADKDVRAEAERQAINSPVQSFASDLMLFALIRLHQLMPDREARIVGTVHDSILFEIKEEHVHKWCPLVKLVMEDMDRVRGTFGCDVTVPIVADIELGSHWAEGSPYMKETDYAAVT